MNNQDPNKAKRGRALTIYILFMVFLSLSDLGFRLTGKYQVLEHNFPAWTFYGYGALNLIVLVFYYGMWKMKKWGVYGTIVLLVVGNTVILYYAHAPADILISAIAIAVFAIVVWKPFQRMT